MHIMDQKIIMLDCPICEEYFIEDMIAAKTVNDLSDYEWFLNCISDYEYKIVFKSGKCLYFEHDGNGNIENYTIFV